MIVSNEVPAALREALRFEAIGLPAGNLSLGRGVLAGTAAMVCLVEPRLASGALGVTECDKLAAAFRAAALSHQPLLLYLDSAGAKVSEGLPALGAFRRLYREALALRESGTPILAVCGQNCFGGASMLAALAGRRLYSANTRFAMSGPALLAQATGADATDDMAQAIASAAIGAAARVELGDGNLAYAEAALCVPPVESPADRHARLGSRLKARSESARLRAAEPFHRNDVDRLFPEGYEATIQAQLLRGSAHTPQGDVAVLGWIGPALMGADGAWRLADAALALLSAPPRELTLIVEGEAHSTSLEDERRLLSEYLAHLAGALFSLRAAGTAIRVVVPTTLGGGVYVALAAPATELVLLYQARIQLLPGRAIASILGAPADAEISVAAFLNAGVADRELKLGLV